MPVTMSCLLQRLKRRKEEEWYSQIHEPPTDQPLEEDSRSGKSAKGQSLLETTYDSATYLRKVVHDLMRTFERKLPLIDQALGGIHSHWEGFAIVLAPGEVFDVLEIAKSPRVQVRAHDGRTLKGHHLQARLAAFLGSSLWHV